MCGGNCSTSREFHSTYPDEEVWYEELERLARQHDISVADEDAWLECYHQEKTPLEALGEDYPEVLVAEGASKAKKDRSGTAMARPCAECPWRRQSAPGWLGSNTATGFLQLSDAGVHLPCDLTVDYEKENWRDEADVSPQCAGHAIFLANRCKLPRNPEQKVLPADRDLVFSWPHEFVAHHEGLKPEQLADVFVHELQLKVNEFKAA